VQCKEVKWIDNALIDDLLYGEEIFVGNPNVENLETNIWNMWENFKEILSYRFQDNRLWS